MTTVEILAVESAEQTLLRAAEALGRAKAREMELEMQRVHLKADITKALLGTENPLTRKAHSATSADDAAALTDEYAAHLQVQREAVVETCMAKARWQAAKMWARVAGGDE